MRRGPQDPPRRDRSPQADWIAGVAARDGRHLGRQLGQIERLHQVVVRSRVQPLAAPRNPVTGGEDHQPGSLRPRVAVHAGNRDPSRRAASGRAGSNRKQPRERSREPPQSRGPVHRVAAGSDLVANRFAQRRIVLDRQDPHGTSLAGVGNPFARRSATQWTVAQARRRHLTLWRTTPAEMRPIRWRRTAGEHRLSLRRPYSTIDDDGPSG